MTKSQIVINEKEYAEILRRAVDEIHTARHTIALQVN